MTIYEVKRIHLEHFPESHFFDRKAMRFFGQRLRDYSVRHNGLTTWRVACPMRDYTGKQVGMTVRIFDAVTGELKSED